MFDSSSTDNVHENEFYIGLTTINTQFMKNSQIVYPVKMEYGWNSTIFWIKLMMKKYFWNSSMRLEKFHKILLHRLERRVLERLQIHWTKMTIFAHGGISKKKLIGLCGYGKWNFKSKISTIFHFHLVDDGWIMNKISIVC